MISIDPAAMIRSWEKVGGRGVFAPLDALVRVLIGLVRQTGGERIALSESLTLRNIRMSDELLSRDLTVIGPYRAVDKALAEALSVQTDRKEYFNQVATADVGITEATYGISETGTLLLFDRTGIGDPVSLLPPVHIALLRRNRIVASFEDLLPVLTAETQVMLAPGNSMILVSGPSRTADIEQVLITGVHGPQEAHLVIVD